ncbi:lysozyme inhibitor LprI family protein [Desulfovibrio ferrophilus]|nr:lysozyme inhibitor LprI family protein [Desulfovibrio ferrophilus]
MLRLLMCFVWFGVVVQVMPASAQTKDNSSSRVSGLVDCGGELSPADRMHCENVQLDAADDDLNRIYRTLMEVLDKDARAMLLDGQRGWLKYRDKNFELFSSAASPGGQQGMAEQIHILRELTEARVRELENLYRLFQNSGLLAVAPDAVALEDEPAPHSDTATDLEAGDPIEFVDTGTVPETSQPEGAFSGSESDEAGQDTAGENGVPITPEKPRGRIILNGKVVQLPGTIQPDPEGKLVVIEPSSPTDRSAPAEQPKPAESAASEDLTVMIEQEPVSPLLPAAPEVSEAEDSVVPKTEVKSQAGLKKLLGRHPLRLQWLSGDPIGEAWIEDRGGVYWLSGSQGREGHELLIDGRISTVRKDNFTFHGTVTTTLGFLNEGKPCVRQGRMWFVRKDGRPFWRLQSITNPCSGVSDYIDIYVDFSGE